MNTLVNKVAVVTGAGRGIGKEIALLLAREGAQVVVNDLGSELDGQGKNTRLADEVVKEIQSFGGEAVANANSVAMGTEAGQIIQSAMDNFGKIDIVVNNAGFVRDKMLLNMSEEDFDAVVQVHLKGCFNMTKAAGGYFKKQNSGRFINMTSTVALIGGIGQANYASAKMGIVGLNKITALEMKRFQVTANIISPFAWSRMNESIPTDTEEQQKRVDKLKKMTPDHIAPLAVYLAGDAAAGISGQIFAVRGKEIVLFSQIRPVKTAINMEGWTVDNIGDTLMGYFGPSFTPLDVTNDVFPYEPIV